MSLKLFGTNIYISVPFCIILTFLLIIDMTGLMTISLATIIIHESGHLAMMRRLGCNPKQIRLTPYGVVIVGVIPKLRNDQIKIAFSGPLMNLLVGALFAVFYYFNKNELCATVFCVQFIVAAINLLPANGLDGGTILFCFLSKRQSEERARLVMTIISFALAFLICFLGVFIIVRVSFNPSLVLLGVYLLILNLMKV
ncbi:MAG: hypothetical protein RR177_05370 [Oscillospiraceae bacterium]